MSSRLDGLLEVMDTNYKGKLAESFVLAHLIRAGKEVLFPYSDNSRYDLVVDEGGKFTRIQCKFGKYLNGAVRFKTSKSQRNGTYRKYTPDEIDYFGVYCPENDQSYLVPVGEVCNLAEVALRVEEPGRNQYKTIRWAKNYLI